MSSCEKDEMTAPAASPQRRRRRCRLTEEQKKERVARFHAKERQGEESPFVKSGRTRAALRKSDILQRIQNVDIMEFARIAGVSFEGRPGQELTLRLMYGLPLPEGRVKTFVRRECEGFVLDEVEISWFEYYRLLTGNEELFEPNEPKNEGFFCVGARSGKTKETSIIAAYEATRNKWLGYLSPKETGYAGIVATDLDQARDLIQESTLNLLLESDLRPLVADAPKRQVILTNGLHIRSFACNKRAGRGYPYFFTVYDEAGFFYLEGAKADTEIHKAINPRRLQFPGGKHVEISTPAGKQGRFYAEHCRGAQVHKRLTIQAPTWLFRPELHRNNPDFIPGEYDSNAAAANREYGAEFDETIDTFLPEHETLAAMVLPSDVPYDPAVQYAAGLDASGLSGNDRFGFAIAGKDASRNKNVVAAVRSWLDKEPDRIMADIGLLCKMYRVRLVYTDRYAKGWVHAALIKLRLDPALAPNDMETWLNFKGLIVGGKVEMPLDEELKDGLLKTKVAYSTDQKPRIVRVRNRKGHGDKAEGVNKAIWGCSQNIYGRVGPTHEEQQMQARRLREEENYDPLTYGRV